MKHNDRLDHIIESAFRPYRLRAEPPALLSLCLDFDQLITWYSSSLSNEMRMRVDNVFNLWRSGSRAESNISGQFFQGAQLLPWYPNMSEGNRHFFFSGMPGELQAVLVQYLEVARIRREQVAISYKDAINRLDAKVCLAFANAFLYMAETFQKETLELQSRELQNKAIADLTKESEIEERLTWLSSVANDLERSVQRRVFEVEQVLRDDAEIEGFTQDIELQALSLRCLSGLYRAQESALSQATYLMASLFFRDIDVTDEVYLTTINKAIFDTDANTDATPYFSKLLNQLEEQVFLAFEQVRVKHDYYCILLLGYSLLCKF